MAETNILSISLKEYKQEIDTLKGSLLGLDKESAAYKETLKQVRDMQTKLNEVLSDTKKSSDAADNSMNALKKSLSEMKKEVGNMDVGSQAFKDLSAKILETTNKLKDLEATQGTFSRNVGNYTNSVVDAFAKLNINVAGLAPALKLAEAASGGLNTAWKALAAHPFIAIASAVLLVFTKIKDAINGNEAASNKWKQAMSAFQPIIDLFNRAMGWLAEKLADGALWLGSKLPAATIGAGKVLNSLIGIIGNVVKGIVYFATIGPKVFGTAISKIAEGVSWLGGKFSEFLSAIGADEYAAKMKAVANNVSTFMKNVSAGVDSTVNGAIKGIDNLVAKGQSAVTNMSTSMAKSMETSMSMTKKQQQLTENIRRQTEASAASEARQAELRDKMATARGEEKIRLAKELRKEIDENGKREAQIAKEQLKYAQYRAAQAPNSAADNDELARLSANVQKAEAMRLQSLARVDKMIQKSEDAQTKAAEKASKEQVAAREKALKEQEKLEREYAKSINDAVANERKNLDTKLKEIDAQQSLERETGGLTIEKEKEYENQRYELKKQYYNNVNKLYTDAVESQKLSAEDQLKISSEYTRGIQAETIESIKHNAEIAKLSLQEIKTNAEDAMDAEEIANDMQTIADKYVTIFSDLYGTDKEKAVGMIGALEISDEDKQRIIQGLEDVTNNEADYEARLEEQAHQHSLNMIAIKVQELSQIRAIVGENSDAYLSLSAEINAMEEQEALRHADAMAKIENNRQKTNDASLKQQVKAYTNYSKGVSGVMNTVADIMKADIDRKVENGEMSEEQAKKEFENVKKMEISAAILQTLSGALASQMSVWKDSSLNLWSKIAMSALLGAETLASGYAQVQQIKNTQYGSEGTGGEAVREGGNIDFTSVRVSPIIDEQADINARTVINAEDTSDQRVYILESDIQESNKRVEIRQAETTF